MSFVYSTIITYINIWTISSLPELRARCKRRSKLEYKTYIINTER